MSVENLNDVQDMRPRLKSSIIPYSSENILTFDMGWLIPQDWFPLVPGDKMNVGHSSFFRFDPFMNPILSRCKAQQYDFEIPVRLLYNEREYEKWFTGGVNGVDDDKLKPHFTFKNFYKFCYNILGSEFGRLYGGLFGFNTLCDYLGLPVNQCYVPQLRDPSDSSVVIEEAHFLLPSDVVSEEVINIEPFLAYALVYREYFLWNHDETSVWVTNEYLQDFTKIPFMCLDDLIDSENADYDSQFVEFLVTILSLQRKGWQHDYFTSALPNIQSGDPAVMPLGSSFTELTATGSASSIGGGSFLIEKGQYGAGNPLRFSFYDSTPDSENAYWDDTNVYWDPTSGQLKATRVGGSNDPIVGTDNYLSRIQNAGATLNNAQLRNLKLTNIQTNGSSSGFTINDLRLLNAIQVFKERQNIGGARLKEALYMQFGVTVPDDRLDRPDFVGYMDFPVQISEVLQTSQSTDDSVLGDQGGHAIGAANQQTIFNYFVLEPMIHLSLVVLTPDTYYMQGMSPFWNKISKFDEWNPVFNHLSDQAVGINELYFRPTETTNPEFGYLPRFAEYKARYNRISGNLRKVDSGYMSWHQGRYFGATPMLNQEFINSKPTERVFAVIDNDEEIPFYTDAGFQMHTHVIGVISNNVKLSRNIPSGSDPSLNID